MRLASHHALKPQASIVTVSDEQLVETVLTANTPAAIRTPIHFPTDREGLERICSVFIHTSTVTHDQLNNVVWNYSTLNFMIPTVVAAQTVTCPSLALWSETESLVPSRTAV